MPKPAGNSFDVAIIGGGVCGCSLLYALSRFRLRLLLLEKTNDVGVAATKANSAILHAGYDPEPGTRMAGYNVAGNPLSKQLCKDLDILMEETGSLVIGFDEADRKEVRALYGRGKRNGVPGLCILEKDTLRRMEPNLNPKAAFALYAPTAAVVNPWELASAQAETAVQNGAEVWLDAPVTAIEKLPGGFALQSGQGVAAARFVVNAAGVGAADVARLAGPGHFEIFPSKGQYFLLEKAQGKLVRSVIFQCPTPYGKGVLVAPTVHGNLLCGPNAEASHNVSVTAEGLKFVKKMALKSVPDIDFRQTVRSFAGLRAYSDVRDFIVGQSEEIPGFFNMAGIKSPGLTAAAAIARDMVGMLAGAGLALDEKPEFIKTRRVGRFSRMSEAERAEVIRQNPLYGRIVCRCEMVTEGEVVNALRRPLPPRSLDAVKRRCGPGMGRCQSGFCGPRVQAVIARELGIPPARVPQDRTGMDIVIGRTKDMAVMGGAPAAAKEGPAHG